MYKDKTLSQYLDDLSAKLPAPGGGSASAMAAALGAALLSMVVNFTLGKPKYAMHEKELSAVLQDSERLRGEFLRLVDDDVAAYSSKDIQRSIDVPLAICRLSHDAARLCPAICQKGNVNLISDVAVAAVFFESAFSAARVNVEVNLLMLNDRKLVKAVNTELAVTAKSVAKIRATVEKKVRKILNQ